MSIGLTSGTPHGQHGRCSRGGTALCVLMTVLSAGCGDAEVRYEIQDVRNRVEPGPPAPVDATDEQRLFGGDGASPPGSGTAGEPARPRRRWTFATPPGWTELPRSSVRDLGWRVGPEGAAECTLSVLEGAAGGLAANVNRWRQQMSQAPADADALAALPATRWLGVPARRVELDGAYRGMGTAIQHPQARLLGLIAVLPRGTAFLKLVGPAGVVAVESAPFQALADSLALADEPPEPPSAPGEPKRAPTRLSWTAPEGWVQQPARMMREVTYAPASAPAVSVYVSVLSGTAGGTRANLERWRGEMGLGPLSDADLAALDRGPVLGGTGVYVELQGTFSGMGGQPAPGSALLGMVRERPQGSVFVKMTGPAAQVVVERGRFRAFCESLRE